MSRLALKWVRIELILGALVLGAGLAYSADLPKNGEPRREVVDRTVAMFAEQGLKPDLIDQLVARQLQSARDMDPAVLKRSAFLAFLASKRIALSIKEISLVTKQLNEQFGYSFSHRKLLKADHADWLASFHPKEIGRGPSPSADPGPVIRFPRLDSVLPKKGRYAFNEQGTFVRNDKGGLLSLSPDRSGVSEKDYTVIQRNLLVANESLPIERGLNETIESSEDFHDVLSLVATVTIGHMVVSDLIGVDSLGSTVKPIDVSTVGPLPTGRLAHQRPFSVVTFDEHTNVSRTVPELDLNRRVWVKASQDSRQKSARNPTPKAAEATSDSRIQVTFTKGASLGELAVHLIYAYFHDLAGSQLRLEIKDQENFTIELKNNQHVLDQRDRTESLMSAMTGVQGFLEQLDGLLRTQQPELAEQIREYYGQDPMAGKVISSQFTDRGYLADKVIAYSEKTNPSCPDSMQQ